MRKFLVLLGAAAFSLLFFLPLLSAIHSEQHKVVTSVSTTSCEITNLKLEGHGGSPIITGMTCFESGDTIPILGRKAYNRNPIPIAFAVPLRITCRRIVETAPGLFGYGSLVGLNDNLDLLSYTDCRLS